MIAGLVAMAWNAIGWLGDRTGWPRALDALDTIAGDLYYRVTGMEG